MILRSNKTIFSGSVEPDSQPTSRRSNVKLENRSNYAKRQPPTALDKETVQKRSSQLFAIRAFKLFQDYFRHLAVSSLTAAAVLMACSLRGDVALVVIFIYKSYIASSNDRNATTPTIADNTSNSTSWGQSSFEPRFEYQPILPDYLQIPNHYNMEDLVFYIAVGVISSQVMYQTVCGFLQLYFYTLKRDKPEEWKCQPHRFLTRSNEIHEMVVGTINMTIAGTVSGVLTCWVVNGNYSTVYFDVREYGYTYFFLSFVLLFLWFEAAAFYSHFLLHTPWFYKNCHKHHHRYHSPSAYSVIAMSPFELAFYDSLMAAPLFLFPIHGLVYVVDLVYIYYFGMMDHSGIKMTSWFPWQPDTMFHDDHHKYFHVNFGFNSSLFDWLHGTLRQPDREYGEDIFGGKGKEKKANK